MIRKEFLKRAGIAGLASVLPMGRAAHLSAAAAAAVARRPTAGTCTVTPSETAGPYPLDLSSNSTVYRTAINETQTGLPLNLTFTFVNTSNNCAPIANARIDVWHCNKDGYYSGYSNQPGYLGTQSYAGATWCRGIQLTDANGVVNFTTIFPGWYTPRVTHIHIQVYLSSTLVATTQLAFADSLDSSVYTTNSLYTPHGSNTGVSGIAADMVFSDGYAYQVMTTTGSATTSISASMTIGVAAGTVTAARLAYAPETGGQFVLGQNFPNPYVESTTVPFTLTNGGDVELALFDQVGRKVHTFSEQGLAAGDHSLVINPQKLGLAAGNYVYQLQVSNSHGEFRQCKMMTAGL